MMVKKRFAPVLVAGLGMLAAFAADAGSADAQQEYEEALALTPDLENGRRAYLTCAVCHRPEGWGTPDGTYPQIAGQLNTVIIKQLADIRARKRDNPIMYPFAVPRILGGTQEIADVAAYISQLPMTPVNGIGPGVDLERGETLYVQYCADCHGKHGEGDRQEHTPAVWGQHFNYLVRQFEWIKISKRRNSDPEMVKQIRGFSGRDISAVLDYTSRLKPPAERLASNPGWRNPDFPNYVRLPAPPVPSEY
jgi:cytochrome c553